jgi:hypothetical protein
MEHHRPERIRHQHPRGSVLSNSGHRSAWRRRPGSPVAHDLRTPDLVWRGRPHRPAARSLIQLHDNGVLAESALPDHRPQTRRILHRRDLVEANRALVPDVVLLGGTTIDSIDRCARDLHYPTLRHMRLARGAENGADHRHRVPGHVRDLLVRLAVRLALTPERGRRGSWWRTSAQMTTRCPDGTVDSDGSDDAQPRRWRSSPTRSWECAALRRTVGTGGLPLDTPRPGARIAHRGERADLHAST